MRTGDLDLGPLTKLRGAAPDVLEAEPDSMVLTSEGEEFVTVFEVGGDILGRFETPGGEEPEALGEELEAPVEELDTPVEEIGSLRGKGDEAPGERLEEPEA